MKKLFVLILSLFLLTSCGNNSKVTVNDKEYKLNDILYVNLTLDSEDSNVNICPTIKISKDDESDSNKVIKDLDYSLDNLEVFNYNVKELNETHDKASWYLKLNLEKMNTNDIDNIKDLVKLKLTIKEKGNYHITINNSDEECYTKYKDNLKLEITK